MHAEEEESHHSEHALEHHDRTGSSDEMNLSADHPRGWPHTIMAAFWLRRMMWETCRLLGTHER